MAEWYYRAHVSEAEQGPIALDALLKLIHSGSVQPDSQVRPSNSQKWIRADSLLERLKQLKAKEPSPPVVIVTDSPRPVIKEQAVFDALGIYETAPPGVDVEDSPGMAPAYRPHRHTTERRYPALRAIVWFYRFCACLTVLLAIIVVVFSIVTATPATALVSAYLVFVGVVTLAIGEGIRIVLDIESSARQAVDELASIRAAVEHTATWQR